MFIWVRITKSEAEWEVPREKDHLYSKRKKVKAETVDIFYYSCIIPEIQSLGVCFCQFFVVGAVCWKEACWDKRILWPE